MTNLFNLPEGRPDPAHWTRTNVGFTSPLWWPFLMAAGAGAAWWTYSNWSRVAANSWTGDLQRLGGHGPRREEAPAVPPPAAASLDQSVAVQGDASADRGGERARVDDGSDVIDAAYAANLGPVPSPKKRAAGKKTAGKTASKTTARKTSPKKTAAKKTAAKKTKR